MERMTKTAFARWIEVDEKLVRRAIKDGKIVNGVVLEGKRQWLLPEIAKAEFVASLNVGRLMSDATKKLANESAKVVDPVADVVEAPKERVKPVPRVISPAEQLDIAYELARKNTVNDLSTRKLEMELEEQAIKLKKLKGELVSLKDIRNALYDAGVELRSSFLSVSERTVDNVRAAVDRSEALQVMNEELAKVLKTVAGLHTKDLKV